MKIFNNTNHLTKTVLAVIAGVAFVGCTNSSDRAVTTDTTTTTTTSNTTLAADDTPKTLDTTGEVPPAAADQGASSTDTSTKTETKTTKHMKHKAKKAHKKAKEAAAVWVPSEPVVSNQRQDDSYYYNSEDMAQSNGSTDVSEQYDDAYSSTYSGMTTAPDVYRETGLSPFAQEPNSRIPAQIGSGQLTGEDKSTTILEGPSLFQDPSALGRDLIR